MPVENHVRFEKQNVDRTTRRVVPEAKVSPVKQVPDPAAVVAAAAKHGVNLAPKITASPTKEPKKENLLNKFKNRIRTNIVSSNRRIPTVRVDPTQQPVQPTAPNVAASSGATLSGVELNLSRPVVDPVAKPD